MIIGGLRAASPDLTEVPQGRARSTASPIPTITATQAQGIVEQLHKDTNGGWFGWTTDEDDIFKLFRPLADPDIALVDELYLKNYGEHVKAAMVSALDDDQDDVDHFLALYEGKDNADQILAVEVHAEIEGIFGDNDEILGKLETLTAPQRQSFADRYARADQYGHGQTGLAARQFVVDHYVSQANPSPVETERLQWLLTPPTDAAGQENWSLGQARYQAERLNHAYEQGDLDKAAALLGKLDDKQLPLVQKEFDARYGQDGNKDRPPVGEDATAAPDRRALAARIDQMRNGPQKTLFKLLLVPKPQDPNWKADVLAARIDHNLQGTNDEAGLRKLIADADFATRQALPSRYNLAHPKESFEARLKSELGEIDHGEILHLIAKPKPDPALATPPAPHASKQEIAAWNAKAKTWNDTFSAWQSKANAWALARAVDGWGTEEADIRTLFAGKDSVQMLQLARDFHAITGDNLKERLAPTGWFHTATGGLFDELRGRDRVELVGQQLKEGWVDATRDPQAAAEQQTRWAKGQIAEEKGWSAGDIALSVLNPQYGIMKASGIDLIDSAEKLWRWDTSYETDGERMQRTLAQAEQALQDQDYDKALTYAGLTQQNIHSYTAARDQASGLLAEGAALVAAGVTVALMPATAPLVLTMAYGGLAGGAAAGFTRFTLNSQADDVLGYVTIGAASGATTAIPVSKLLRLAASKPGGTQVVLRQGALGQSALPKPGFTRGGGFADDMALGAEMGLENGFAIEGTRAAVQSETWKEGWPEGLQSVLKSGTIGGGFGLGGGAVMGGLIPVGLQGIGNARAGRAATVLAEEAPPPMDHTGHTVMTASQGDDGVFYVQIDTPVAPSQTLVLKGDFALARPGRTVMRVDGAPTPRVLKAGVKNALPSLPNVVTPLFPLGPPHVQGLPDNPDDAQILPFRTRPAQADPAPDTLPEVLPIAVGQNLPSAPFWHPVRASAEPFRPIPRGPQKPSSPVHAPPTDTPPSSSPNKKIAPITYLQQSSAMALDKLNALVRELLKHLGDRASAVTALSEDVVQLTFSGQRFEVHVRPLTKNKASLRALNARASYHGPEHPQDMQSLILGWDSEHEAWALRSFRPRSDVEVDRLRRAHDTGMDRSFVGPRGSKEPVVDGTWTARPEEVPTAMDEYLAFERTQREEGVKRTVAKTDRYHEVFVRALKPGLIEHETPGLQPMRVRSRDIPVASAWSYVYPVQPSPFEGKHAIRVYLAEHRRSASASFHNDPEHPALPVGVLMPEVEGESALIVQWDATVRPTVSNGQYFYVKDSDLALARDKKLHVLDQPTASGAIERIIISDEEHTPAAVLQRLNLGKAPNPTADLVDVVLAKLGKKARNKDDIAPGLIHVGYPGQPVQLQLHPNLLRKSDGTVRYIAPFESERRRAHYQAIMQQSVRADGAARTTVLGAYDPERDVFALWRFRPSDSDSHEFVILDSTLDEAAERGYAVESQKRRFGEPEGVVAVRLGKLDPALRAFAARPQTKTYWSNEELNVLYKKVDAAWYAEALRDLSNPQVAPLVVEDMRKQMQELESLRKRWRTESGPVTRVRRLQSLIHRSLEQSENLQQRARFNPDYDSPESRQVILDAMQKKASRLTPEEHDLLLEVIEEGHAALKELLERNFQLTLQVSQRFGFREHDVGNWLVSRDRVPEYALEGLVRGIEKFNPALGFEPSSYLVRSIESYIKAGLTREMAVMLGIPPRQAREIIRIRRILAEFNLPGRRAISNERLAEEVYKKGKVRASLERRLGRRASIQELNAKWVKVRDHYLKRLSQNQTLMNDLHFGAIEFDEAIVGGTLKAGGMAAPSAEEVAVKALTHQRTTLYATLRENFIAAGLTHMERDILSRFYGIGMYRETSLVELSAQLEWPIEQATKELEGALEKIRRHPDVMEALADVMPET